MSLLLIISELSKHIGFIIEAGIEALPQSLLQIAAIVYYKEANYVSIISIFLSMFSVMTKSLIFSQGIDFKTYIWTWLCIVVDFFGIFFILTWVFYTNDTLLKPQFLNSFSIIGQIWFYKCIISVAPIVFLTTLWYIITYWPWIINDIWTHSGTKCSKFGWSVFVTISGAVFVTIAMGVGFIAIEIFCFGFLALLMHAFFTKRWRDRHQKSINDKLSNIIRFVSNASIWNGNNDRILRILAINQNKTIFTFTGDSNGVVQNWIDKIDKEKGVNALRQVTYSDIRNNCGNESAIRDAKIFPRLWQDLKDSTPNKQEYHDCIKCFPGLSWVEKIDNCTAIIGYYIFYIIFPVFTFCKVLQAILPYVILGYLLYYQELFNVDLFQLAMLFTCIGLQFVLLVLGVMVCRTHWFLWHIYPGRNMLKLNASVEDRSMEMIIECHRTWTWDPIIGKYLSELYGDDVSQLIMFYCKNIELVTFRSDVDAQDGNGSEETEKLIITV